jgi:N-acetylneuraminic acid mutarotase
MKKHFFALLLAFTFSYTSFAQGITFNEITAFSGAECEGAVSFVLNGEAYIGLGQTGNNQYTNSFYRYVKNKDRWDLLTSKFPGDGRAYAISFIANGKAYVGLGETTDATTGKVNRVFADLYEYDPATDSWSNFDKGSQAAMKGVGQATVFTVTEGGKTVAHIMGGRNSLGTQNVWYTYTPSTNTWAFPVNNQVELKRFGAIAVTINNKGYVIGGKDDSKTWDNVMQYDPNATSLKYTIYNSAAAYARTNATAIGNGNNFFLAYGDKPNCLLVNSANKTINQLGDIVELKDSRRGMISFLLDNKIYLGLGRGSNGTLNFDLYTIAGATTATKESAPPNKELLLSPNPVNNTLKINNLDDTMSEIIVYNLQGQRLLQQPCHSNNCNIETSNLPNGTYILEQKQAEILSKKTLFVVEH